MFLTKVHDLLMVIYLIIQAGRYRVEVSAPFFFIFIFLFFVSNLICKINLSPRYSRCLDSRVVSTSGSEAVGACSSPG